MKVVALNLTTHSIIARVDDNTKYNIVILFDL